jgi:hypothetical protein
VIRLPLVLAALIGAPLLVAGCSSDPGFPAVHDMPTARTETTLTPDQVKQATDSLVYEREHLNTEAQQAQGQTPGQAPSQTPSQTVGQAGQTQGQIQGQTQASVQPTAGTATALLPPKKKKKPVTTAQSAAQQQQQYTSGVSAYAKQ